MKRGRPRTLEISKIRLDGDTQARCHLDETTVSEYADAIGTGEKMPPVVVFHDRRHYWLSDGFHRIHAHRRAGRESIAAQVLEGTREDAAWYALGANRTNGLRMSNADKERAVKLALRMRPGASDRSIAGHVGVSDKTVSKHRAEMASGAEIPHLNERVGRDGKAYPAAATSPPVTSYGDPPTDDPPTTIGENSDEFPPSLSDDPPPSTEDDPPPSIEDDPPPPMQPVDRVGVSITRDDVAEAFSRDQELVELCTAVSRIKSAVLQAAEVHDPLYGDLTASRFDADATNVRRQIEHCRPYAVCPYCHGEDDRCSGCKGRGWVNKTTYRMVPREKRGKR